MQKLRSIVTQVFSSQESTQKVVMIFEASLTCRNSGNLMNKPVPIDALSEEYLVIVPLDGIRLI